MGEFLNTLVTSRTFEKKKVKYPEYSKKINSKTKKEHKNSSSSFKLFN